MKTQVPILIGLLVLSTLTGFLYVKLNEETQKTLELQSLREELTSVTVEKQQLIDASKEAEGKIMALQNDLDTREAELRAVQSLNEILESDLEQVQQELTIAQADLTAQLTMQQLAQQQLTDIQGQNEILQNEKLALAADNKDLTDANSQLKAEVASLRTRLNSLSQGDTELRAQISELTEKLTARENELASIQRHLDVSPQARTEFSYDGSYIPSPGLWKITTAPSILISFPDPANSLEWGNMVGTESMKPMLDAGHTVILYTGWDRTDLRKGDIISWETSSGIRILHQIVEIRSDGVITKGIHNPTDDGLVTWDQIRGVVVVIVY